jgi:hypothetical protein
VQGVQLHYRAYHLDHVGHIQSVSEFECITDEEAVKKSQELVDGFDVELWHGGRLVTRIASGPLKARR